MKALLMYRDRDFDLQQKLPWNEEALIQDLELNTLFKAMALDDKFLFEVAKKAVLSGVSTDLDTIRYRQNILTDCLKNAAIVRDIYNIAVRAIESEKKVYLGFFISKYPTTIVSRSIEVLLIFVSMLKKPNEKKQNWFEQIFAKGPPMYTFYIADRDESGARALSELKDRGLNLVANALAQSTDHILSFFTMLRTELAFYIGCLNLHGQLAQMGEPTCFPVPVAPGEHRLCFQGLYDVCLALIMKQKIVGNDVNADNKDLMMITGANQGGKSTFLRGIGLSQVMMQCGLFVPAESFSANVAAGLFTHYKREEDTTMESGKLDEELSRMSDIVDTITSNSIVLFNESFAATNEREGSEIARQIITALLEKGIKVFFVTHLYQCAHGFYNNKLANAIFLRAERRTDGTRTFKLTEGEPLQTSYGEDL